MNNLQLPNNRPATRHEKLAITAGSKPTTDKSAEKSDLRRIVLEYIDKQALTSSVNVAIEAMLNDARLGLLPASINRALLKLSSKRSEMFPAKSSIYNWHQKKLNGGKDALVAKHKGRIRAENGWEGMAVDLFNQPSKPGYSNVHRALTEMHGFDCTYQQVKSYLKALPAQLGDKSPARIGKNLFRLTQSDYVRRTTANMQVGDVYVADGYRADVYLAHPITGNIFRCELSVCMDIKSRFVTGWRIDEHEGSFAVQSMWAEAFARHDHVPPLIYVDNGSGYKNSFVDDEIDGFYQRAGVVEVIHSIPGNPHGKGWIERFFRTMKEDFLRMWKPEFYCGHEMADEVRNRIVRECKAGRLQLPTAYEFAHAFGAWLDRYHNRPHPEIKGVTKIQLWQGLNPIPAALDVLELKYQSVQLMVRRGSIKHGKRSYRHPDLLAFNGQKVILNFDMMDNAIAIIKTLKGEFICHGNLITDIDVIASNRLDEKRTIRATEAVKRLEKKIAEQQARAGHVIDAEAIADGVIDLPAPSVDSDELLLELF